MFWFNNNSAPAYEFPADSMNEMIGAAPGRPKIGLALGAGVARGWTHIGVIQKLAEEGIEPDVVSGTSVGALVGGCHAAGRLGELEEFARSLTRTKIFRLLDLSWGKAGLISGDRLRDLLDEALGELRIEELKTPFICIGTELLTGHEIWLRKGRLSKAIRSSYALPGVFSPVYFKELWLIDGAVVNPIPVSACRAMGARMVIAVNLESDAFGGTVIQTPEIADVNKTVMNIATPSDKPRKPQRSILRQMFGRDTNEPGLTTVLMAAFNISQDRLARSRLAGDPADITITPSANDIGLFDFDKAEEAIEIGRDAAAKVVPDIKRAISWLDAAAHATPPPS